MYEAVAGSEVSTPSRLALTVARSGYDGVIFRDGHGSETDVEAIEELADLDVAVGHTVGRADSDSLRRTVADLRSAVTVLLVAGGSVDRNRTAVELPKVDVLLRPMRDDGDMNHVLARAAAQHDVAVELDLGPVLTTGGAPRVAHIRNLIKLRDLLVDAGAPHVVSAGADSHFGVGAPRELAALGEVIGLGEDFVREGLRNWERIVTRNRDRLGDDWIAPGIRTQRDEGPEGGASE